MTKSEQSISDLAGRACKEKGVKALGEAQVRKMLAALKGWKLVNGEITRSYSFKDYYQTMAFVNAVAWVSHRENHHPDLEVSYNKCGVRYSTHSVGGLSENDFICATKLEQLRGI